MKDTILLFIRTKLLATPSRMRLNLKVQSFVFEGSTSPISHKSSRTYFYILFIALEKENTITKKNILFTCHN